MGPEPGHRSSEVLKRQMDMGTCSDRAREGERVGQLPSDPCTLLTLGRGRLEFSGCPLGMAQCPWQQRGWEAQAGQQSWGSWRCVRLHSSAMVTVRKQPGHMGSNCQGHGSAHTTLDTSSADRTGDPDTHALPSQQPNSAQGPAKAAPGTSGDLWHCWCKIMSLRHVRAAPLEREIVPHFPLPPGTELLVLISRSNSLCHPGCSTQLPAVRHSGNPWPRAAGTRLDSASASRGRLSQQLRAGRRNLAWRVHGPWYLRPSQAHGRGEEGKVCPVGEAPSAAACLRKAGGFPADKDAGLGPPCQPREQLRKSQ